MAREIAVWRGERSGEDRLLHKAIGACGVPVAAHQRWDEMVLTAVENGSAGRSKTTAPGVVEYP